MRSNNNMPSVPGASHALNNFKMEVANELGISNYDQIDKGQLSSRQNGYVGGNMTKKMVAFAEHALSQGQTSAVNSASSTIYGNNSNSGNNNY
ncbi:MAG: alpha/beta-type small acid-soluble spore protein [Firmicutes bacterium]|nr:alpha/beta-type small acid-soluble spore protein [Bacillota bacterium]